MVIPMADTLGQEVHLRVLSTALFTCFPNCMRLRKIVPHRIKHLTDISFRHNVRTSNNIGSSDKCAK
jgi:hypothetical protein